MLWELGCPGPIQATSNWYSGRLWNASNYSTAFKNPEIGNIETSICHTEIMWRNECQESKKQSPDGSESCSLRQLHLLRSHILQLSSAKAFYSSWMVHFWSFLNSICMSMIFILSNTINICMRLWMIHLYLVFDLFYLIIMKNWASHRLEMAKYLFFQKIIILIIMNIIKKISPTISFAYQWSSNQMYHNTCACHLFVVTFWFCLTQQNHRHVSHFTVGWFILKKSRICSFHKKQQIINHQQLSGLILKKFQNILNTATITKIIKIKNFPFFGQEIQKIREKPRVFFKKSSKTLPKNHHQIIQIENFQLFGQGMQKIQKKLEFFSKNHQKHYQKIITKSSNLKNFNFLGRKSRK